jgi:Gpi18-like mannosyltransferase
MLNTKVKLIAYSDLKKIVIFFLLWVIVVNIFAVLALNRYNLSWDTAYPWIEPGRWHQVQEWNPIPLHAKWDSFWYISIAKNGYWFGGYRNYSNVVFFPLYPFLIQAVSFYVGDDFVLAGWIVSTIFLLLAIIYLFKLVYEFHPGSNPYSTIFSLLIFPTAFFLNAVYTESLFLFLSITTFYYALRKDFLLAGILGFLASLTRISGFFLFIPIIWEYFKNYGFSRPFNFKLLSTLLIPAGTLSFFLVLYLKFGNFLLYLKLENSWGRSFELNKNHFSLLSHPAIINFSIDALFLVFALASSIFILKRLRTSYGIYILISILIPLSTGTFMSIGRFTLVLFPIYILAGSIKNKFLQMSLVLLSILLFSVNITLFVNNYWAG